MKKQEVFDIIINKQQELVAELEKSYKSYLEEADIDENETKDLDDMSHQDVATDMRNRAYEQYINANNDLEALQRFQQSSRDTATSGAMVETEDKIFILGIAFKSIDEKVKKEIFGVSSLSPAYQEMEGKKKGDSFTLGKQQYKIKSIS